jgi:DNA-binding transcriptional ArsR family regulator
MLKMIFPDEINDAIVALANEKRRRIVEFLQESEEMAYTELLDRLDLRKGSLNHHLNKLLEAGIIDNYAQGDFAGPYNSYYKLSRFGKDMISGILSSVEVSIVTKTTTKPRAEAAAIPSYASPIRINKFYKDEHFSADIPQRLFAATVQISMHPRHGPYRKKNEHDTLSVAELPSRTLLSPAKVKQK